MTDTNSTSINSYIGKNKDSKKSEKLLTIKKCLNLYTKLSLKTHISPNNNFINSIKQDKININLLQVNTKEISNICKVLGNCLHFKSITINLFNIESKK